MLRVSRQAEASLAVNHHGVAVVATAGVRLMPINVRCQRSFASAKQFIKRPPELTWLRLLSIDALGPERGLLLTQEGDIQVALGAVGSSGGRAGVRQETSMMSSSL